MEKMLAVFMVFVTLCVFTSCGGNGSEQAKQNGMGDEITVVFVPKLTGNAFFEAANDGAQEYAAKNGFTVKYMGSPEASVERQSEVIKQAIEEGTNAICISSVDATGLDGVLKEARAAGITVTTWDSDVSGDVRSVMVSQGTPELLGEMLVEMGVKSLASRGLNPETDEINYVWHYSQEAVADQNSWRVAGEAYIKSKYTSWNNVNPDNYYSEQDAEKSVAVGEEILNNHPDIDLIICNDSTALPGQCKAAQNLGKTAQDVTITGFSPPNSIKEFCKAGTIERWGLWDCKIQGALGCYLAYYIAVGNSVKVGDMLDIPDIGTVEVLPNTVLDTRAFTAEDSGVVLLPERVEFTIDNMDNYDF